MTDTELLARIITRGAAQKDFLEFTNKFSVIDSFFDVHKTPLTKTLADFGVHAERDTYDHGTGFINIVETNRFSLMYKIIELKNDTFSVFIL